MKLPHIPKQDVTPIFHGKRPMNALVAASGSGTNFEALLDAAEEEGFNGGFNGLITDRRSKKGEDDFIGAIQIADRRNVPRQILNAYQTKGSRKQAEQTVEGLQAYHQKAMSFDMEMLETVEILERKQGRFDMLFLAGYMQMITGPMLRRFTNKAVNVHPANLLPLKGGMGRLIERQYTGDNAVYDALKDGRTETRSTAIMLDPEPDAGAILVSGPRVEYHGGTVTQDSADAHQRRQKELSDWPAFTLAARLISQGRLGLCNNEYHSVDGNPIVAWRDHAHHWRALPYDGIDMVEMEGKL